MQQCKCNNCKIGFDIDFFQLAAVRAGNEEMRTRLAQVDGLERELHEMERQVSNSYIIF